MEEVWCKQARLMERETTLGFDGDGGSEMSFPCLENRFSCAS